MLRRYLENCPNLTIIEAGVEDKILKDELYLRIMKEFVRRIDKRRMA